MAYFNCHGTYPIMPFWIMLLKIFEPGNSKVRWKMKKKTHPFLKKNIEVADVWKHTLSTHFFLHGCVASHVVSDLPTPPPPPPLPQVQWSKIRYLNNHVAHLVQTQTWYRRKAPVSDRYPVSDRPTSHFQSGASSQNNPTHGHTLWIAMCL